MRRGDVNTKTPFCWVFGSRLAAVTDSTRRGPYAKGVAKRAEILQQALAAYAESDSSGPSLRAIAARVGLSERGLLHYFTSRDELLVAILQARDDADRVLAEAATSVEGLAGIQARSTGTPGLVRLFLEMAAAAPDPQHAAHRFFRDRYARLRDRVGRLVAAGGPTTPDDAAFAARILIAASDGLQAQWLLDPSIDMEADLLRLAVALGAGPRSARG